MYPPVFVLVMTEVGAAKTASLIIILMSSAPESSKQTSMRSFVLQRKEEEISLLTKHRRQLRQYKLVEITQDQQYPILVCQGGGVRSVTKSPDTRMEKERGKSLDMKLHQALGYYQINVCLGKLLCDQSELKSFLSMLILILILKLALQALNTF